MRDRPKNNEGMFKKAKSNEFADYRGDNHSNRFLDHHHLSRKQLENQEKVEREEKTEADAELDRKLANLNSIFDLETSENDLAIITNSHEVDKEKVSLEDQVINLNAKLKSEGKSTKEILSTLLSEYGKEKSLSTWVENWKNFQQLREFAKTKPPKEQKAISQIITKADFTSKSAFNDTLIQIEESEDISRETKKEIALKFGRSEVRSVKQMDNRLKLLKKENQKVLSKIEEERTYNSGLKSKLKELDKKLKNASLTYEEQEKLKAEKKQIEDQIKTSKSELQKLEEAKKEEISFPLRKGFKAVLKKNGKRQIQTLDGKLTVTLPSNKPLFSSGKNRQSINFAFVQNALMKSGLATHLIKPSFKNKSTPDRSLRVYSDKIIRTLGLQNDQILSSADLDVLIKDLMLLAEYKPAFSPYENLKSLGIIDKENRMLKKNVFFKYLEYLRESRGLTSSLRINNIESLIDVS